MWVNFLDSVKFVDTANLLGSKRSKEENLKEMGDISSGMASTVIQLYLKEILQSYLHRNLQVRQPALRVIQLILQQGLVHPMQVFFHISMNSLSFMVKWSFETDELPDELES